MKEEQGPLFPQRLNSLYVDDWTNAYEVVKNVYGERKSIVVLLEWLEVIPEHRLNKKFLSIIFMIS